MLENSEVARIERKTKAMLILKRVANHWFARASIRFARELTIAVLALIIAGCFGA